MGGYGPRRRENPAGLPRAGSSDLGETCPTPADRCSCSLLVDFGRPLKKLRPYINCRGKARGSLLFFLLLWG